ncbi:MAG: hypothetical protein KH452_10385 [Clostridiales bacterium]|nr:hypothetical protein [Clostridiales bacterium]
MLGKLIKYDLKSMSRAFIPIWVLAPVVALVFSLSMRGMVAWAENVPVNSVYNNTFWANGTGIVTVIMMLLFVGVMIALTVMTILFIIQRFWNGLLKDEGYLMFTLPVKTWELITAKGIAATIISCISTLVGILSCVLLVVGMLLLDNPQWYGRWWSFFWTNIGWDQAEVWTVFVLYLLLFIAGIVKSVYQVYAAMALGQFFQGHRVAGACVSYVGIGVVLAVISGICMMILSWILPDYMYYLSQSSFGIVYLVSMLLVTVVQIIIFHVITERVLSTRLNLE